MNLFKESLPHRIRIHGIQPTWARRQISRVVALKRRRDSGKIEKQLEMLRRAASSAENLMPFIMSAVKLKATTGETSDIFRETYGEFKPKTLV
jgi:methylmalonyl-CoA mutase N-terminal domain/subunit